MRALLTCLFAAILGSCAQPQTTPAPPTRGFTGDTYYLSECAHCAGLLGAKGDTLDVVLKGRDFRFCCPACAAAFERDFESGSERVDERMAADQRPLYPIKVSIVSNRPLPDPPVEVILGNRLFRLTDRDEVAALRADPAPFLQRLNQAILDAQSPTYAMKTKCPVQGDILASDSPIDIVIANRMVRVCCLRCARVVRVRPSQYLGMVDYANRQLKEQHALPGESR